MHFIDDKCIVGGVGSYYQQAVTFFGLTLSNETIYVVQFHFDLYQRSRSATDTNNSIITVIIDTSIHYLNAFVQIQE